MSRRRDEPGIDGVLVIDKPAGPTSHDVVALVRRLSGIRRVGHGGTLDPFAVGVLPVFLGRATRLVEYHQGDGKSYRATVCFGATSTTDDLEGELTPVAGAAPTLAAVEAALAAMTGTIQQVPPAYSAIKVGGRRAYALARTGEAVELRPRTVTLSRLEVIAWNTDDPTRPIAVIDVDCSPGTYVRAIARDLGAAVGSGAYLGALVRTASGPFTREAAIGLDALRDLAAVPGALAARLLPLDAGLDAMPVVALEPAEVSDILKGRFVRPAAGLPPGDPSQPVRVRDADGRLVAIAHLDGARLAPEKVLVDAAPATPAAEVGA